MTTVWGCVYKDGRPAKACIMCEFVDHPHLCRGHREKTNAEIKNILRP